MDLVDDPLLGMGNIEGEVERAALEVEEAY